MQSFQKTEIFIEKPFKSYSDLGTVLASELDSSTIEIKREGMGLKYFCIHHDRKFCSGRQLRRGSFWFLHFVLT